MKCLEFLLTQRINGYPVTVRYNHFGDFTKTGNITFAVPWEYDFVNARQNFKKRSFHGALFIRGFTISINHYL